MEMMASGGGMMQQQQGQPKNYKLLFKAEKDFYEILNYKFALNDVEEAFLQKFSNWLRVWPRAQIINLTNYN